VASKELSYSVGPISSTELMTPKIYALIASGFVKTLTMKEG